MGHGPTSALPESNHSHHKRIHKQRKVPVPRFARVVEAAARERYFQEDFQQIVAWDQAQLSKKNHLSRWKH